MARVQDTWRLHRAKANFTAEAFGGATQPTGAQASNSGPLRAVYVYLKPLTAGAARVAYLSTDTFAIAGVKLSDIDVDNVVDSTDDAVRTATLASCTYWTEIRIPMGGALRWGVECSAMTTPATATNFEIWYREEPISGESET